MFRAVLLASAMLALCVPNGRLNAQASGTASQKATLMRVCGELLREMDRIRAQSAGNRRLLADANEASRSLSWLLSSAGNWRPSSEEEGQGLRESLEGMLVALRGMPRDSRDFEAMLNVVADDLRAKRTHCAYEGLAATQTVRVATKRNGVTEVKGLEVWYVETFFESDVTRRRQFKGYSSPAEHSLVPGRYVIWSRQIGKPPKEGEPKGVRIGRTEDDVKGGVAKGSPIDIEVYAP